jgi:hypothetical protein
MTMEAISTRSAQRYAAGPWTVVLLVAAAAAALALALEALAPSLPAAMPGSETWDGDYAHVGQLLRWTLGDTTEPVYVKSALAGATMMAGAGLAHWAFVTGRRRCGFDLACGTGLFPWVVLSASLGLLAGNLAWGWMLGAYGGWLPTFVPFVSVPPAIVLLYGPGWRVALTGAALGAALTTPVAVLVYEEVCLPLDLPGVVGATTGMWIGALIAFPLCRALPWIGPPLPKPDDPEPAHRPTSERAWAPRRMLADFTEAPFYGNEWASAGLLLGTVAAYLLNPALPMYGSGLLPETLAAQVLAAAVSVGLWRRAWATVRWYPTFVPIVSVAPATVLAFGGTVQSIVAGALLGALAGPPVAAALSRRLPVWIHPFVGNVMSMTICTAVIVSVLRLVPGFEGA